MLVSHTRDGLLDLATLGSEPVARAPRDLAAYLGGAP